MASIWNSAGRQVGKLLLRELRRLQSGTQPGGRAARPFPPRPVSSRAVPSSGRARHVDYSPSLDGKADPGEVVWTWVTFEEDPGQGKDRPVLVVGREGTDILLGLMLSSQSKREGQREWMALGIGEWDSERRPSWVRMDRVLDVPEEGIRREGAIMDRDRFDRVTARLRDEHGWD